VLSSTTIAPAWSEICRVSARAVKLYASMASRDPLQLIDHGFADHDGRPPPDSAHTSPPWRIDDALHRPERLLGMQSRVATLARTSALDIEKATRAHCNICKV
jgi:hypothetical protein